MRIAMATFCLVEGIRLMATIATTDDIKIV